MTPLPGSCLLSTLFILTWIAFITTRRPAADALDIASCNRPLGMESGAIGDSQIAASSSYDEVNVGARHARLRKEERGGAWCPAKQIEETVTEFLQIDLRRLHVITAIETQGRFGNGHGVEYAEAYIIEYQREPDGEWKVYRNRRGERIVKANKNTYVIERAVLEPPLIAQSVRLIPHSEHARTVCMRVELHGCQFANEAAVWYSMPQGDVYNADTQLYDDSYDGYGKDGRLYLGLGQLVDGMYGAEHINFRKKPSKSSNDAGNIKSGDVEERPAYEWVGWRNTSVRDGIVSSSSGADLTSVSKKLEPQPIDITWKFENVREFKAVHIHASNLLHRNIGLFSKVSLMFSIGGKYYLDDPLVFDLARATGANGKRGLMPTEPALNVTIPINNRVGQYIKMLLYFSNEWMLLSEITFESVEADSTNIVTEAATSTTKKTFVEKLLPASIQRMLLTNSTNAIQKSAPLTIDQQQAENFENATDAQSTTPTAVQSATSIAATVETPSQQLVIILSGALVAVCFIFVVVLLTIYHMRRRSRRYMSATSRHSKFRSTRSASSSSSAANRSDFLFHFDSKPPDMHHHHHTNVTDIGGPHVGMLGNNNTMTFHTNPAMSGVNMYGSERGSDDSNQTAEAIYQEPGEACLLNGADASNLNGYPSPFMQHNAYHTNSPAAVYRNAATCGVFGGSPPLNSNSPSSLLNTLYNHQRLLQQQQSGRTMFSSPVMTSIHHQHPFLPQPPYASHHHQPNITNLDFAPYNTMSTLSTLVPASSTCGGSAQFFAPASSNHYQQTTGMCLNSLFPPPPPASHCLASLLQHQQQQQQQQQQRQQVVELEMSESPSSSTPSSASTSPVDQTHDDLHNSIQRQQSQLHQQVLAKTLASVTPKIGIRAATDAASTFASTLKQIPMDSLKFIETIGGGSFGEVCLCELAGAAAGESAVVVAVKMLRETSAQARDEFQREIELSSRLDHDNIVRVLGVCGSSPAGAAAEAGESPPSLCMVVEYMKFGDLNSYLKRHSAEDSAEASLPALSQNCLLYMAYQIANGMQYLERSGYVHRDLATRNCLVGDNYSVKISDFGMTRRLFENDYYRVEGQAMMPIRWMAWESLLLGKFTTKSDVWSFGVTLWEILTLCREQPYGKLRDSEVVENATILYEENSTADQSNNAAVTAREYRYLPRPVICSKLLYERMQRCWHREPAQRPSFSELSKYLQSCAAAATAGAANSMGKAAK